METAPEALPTPAGARLVAQRKSESEIGGGLSTGGQTDRGKEAAVASKTDSARDNPQKVLEPERFFGQAKAGYAAAQKIPDICARLFCYCGCDLTDCHGSLLDCFTTDHGVDCHICQEEAIRALILHKKGKSLKYIQKVIDKKYSKEYPFEIESDALKRYRASRLWGKHKSSGKVDRKALERDGKKVRKLREDGSCCADDKNKK